MNTPARASLPVIKRLPKYYRYLCSLQADGINSISSRELAAQMGTEPQTRNWQGKEKHTAWQSGTGKPG